ncbi:hypothetical protein ACWEKM_23840 [Streptomyces sp. NPDC004752]
MSGMADIRSVHKSFGRPDVLKGIDPTVRTGAASPGGPARRGAGRPAARADADCPFQGAGGPPGRHRKVFLP